MRRPLAALLLTLLSLTAAAQRELLVNGAPVAGLDTRLLPGTAYAPAVDLARAFGAALAIDAPNARVALTLGAAVVSFAIVDDPAGALALPVAVLRDGAPRPGPAAVWNAGRVYLPVKALGEALGGDVAYLAANALVAVVLPRPSLQVALEGSGASEGVVFALSAPTRVTTFVREGVVELRFDRTDLAEPIVLTGDRFERVEVNEARGNVHATVAFPAGPPPMLVELPDGDGMRVLVSFAPRRAVDDRPQDPAAASVRWVLDADHGPGDDGVTTKDFVDRLAIALEERGVVVERTRIGPAPVSLEGRAAAGAAGDGLVSIHEADLPAGSMRLWVLGDAESVAALDRAIRSNAAAALERADTDALRRSLALALAPRLDWGPLWASALAGELTARGFSVEPPLAAPLAVLVGAAGRGILVEVSPIDLADPAVVAPVADALMRAWSAVPR